MNDGENILEQLAVELMTKKGVSVVALGQPTYDQFKEDLIERMNDVINGAIYNALEEQNKLAEFEALLDNNEDTSDFLTMNIPNIDQLTAQALADFCDKY